jgi:sulfur carrier protein ThiS
VAATIEPEPSEEEREAIAAALEAAPEPRSAWAEAALREGVEEGDPEA